MNQMMSAEDFDARADSILTRVKYGLDKQDSSSKNNNSGASDLSGHYCPVCRKLMVYVRQHFYIILEYGNSIELNDMFNCVLA